VCPFVFFLLAIVLYVLLRYTDSDCLFGVFKLFIHLYSLTIINISKINMRRAITTWKHNVIDTTDFPVVKVHVDELSSARIWQHNLYVTLSVNVNIHCRLPIKVYYRICSLRHFRIEIVHGSQNVL
jgi:hypothetical protein